MTNCHVIYRRHLLEHFLVQMAENAQHKVELKSLKMFLERCVGLSPQEVSKQFKISVRSQDVAHCKGGWLGVFQALVDLIFRDPRLKKILDLPLGRNQSSDSSDSKNPPRVRHNDLAYYTKNLGFAVQCSGNIPHRLYSVLELVDKYHYQEKITLFTALNSATVIEKIRAANPESHVGSDFVYLDLNRINSEIQELRKELDQAKHENDRLAVLQALVKIASQPGVILHRPGLLQDIAKCYYHLGAFTDCILVFDYALSFADRAQNPASYKYGVYVWLASGIRSILCHTSNVQHFIENLRDLQYLIEQVKSYNTLAHNLYQPTPTEVKIEALWNVFYLTPALHMAYSKTKANGSIDKIETAYDDLSKFVIAVEKGETNLHRYKSGLLKDDVERIRKSGIPIPDNVNLLLNTLVEP